MKNCKEFEIFFCFKAIQLIYHGFIDGDKRHETPGSQTKYLITHDKAVNMNFIFAFPPLPSMSHRVDANWHRWILCTQWVCAIIEEIKFRKLPILQQDCLQTCPTSVLRAALCLLSQLGMIPNLPSPLEWTLSLYSKAFFLYNHL